jgi:hypothetical protein
MRNAGHFFANQRYTRTRIPCLRDKKEAARICEFIASGGDASSFMETFPCCGFPRIRSGCAPPQNWPRESDDDAQFRVHSKLPKCCEWRWFVRYGSVTSPNIYTPSTPSAARHRTARTRFSVSPRPGGSDDRDWWIQQQQYK